MLGHAVTSKVNNIGNASPVKPIAPNLCGWLEATDVLSYSGSGQNFASLVTAPADGTTQAMNAALLGTTSGTESYDPTFSGEAGTPDAAFTLDGNDIFIQQNATLTAASILNNMHRSDNAGAFVWWAGTIPTDNSTAHALWGNHSSGVQVGVSLSVSTAGVLQLVFRNSTNLTVSMAGVPRGVPVLIVASWRGAPSTDNIRLWVNSTRKMTYSGTPPTETNPNTRNMYICGANAAQFLAAGSKFKSFGYGNKFINDDQAADIFAKIGLRHNWDYLRRAVWGAINPVTMAAIGDSMTLRNLWSKSGAASTFDFCAEGHYAQYLALTNQRMYFPPANNFGASGEETTAIVARKATAAQGRHFDIIFILAGTNDVYNNPVNDAAGASALYNTITGNLAALYDYYATTMGKRVHALTIPPRINWGPRDSTQIAYAVQLIKDVNVFIRAQAGTRNGLVTVTDTYPLLNNGSDQPMANTTVDYLHLAPYGAWLVGKQIKADLALEYGTASPDFVTGNLLANGTLSGTAGTLAGGATGAVPDSFTGALAGGTGAATRTLVLTKTSANVCQMALTCSTGASSDISGVLNQSVSAGFAVGDVVYAEALVEVITPTPVAIFESALSLSLTGTGTTGVTDVKGMTPYAAAGDANYIPDVFAAGQQILIRTPDMTIASGTGLALNTAYSLKGNTDGGAAASGTVEVKGLALKKR